MSAPPSPGDLGWLAGMLQLSDTFYPTGSYAHSFGLEGLVQSGAVRDLPTLRAFLLEEALPTLARTDLAVCARAWLELPPPAASAPLAAGMSALAGDAGPPPPGGDCWINDLHQAEHRGDLRSGPRSRGHAPARASLQDGAGIPPAAPAAMPTGKNPCAAAGDRPLGGDREEPDAWAEVGRLCALGSALRGAREPREASEAIGRQRCALAARRSNSAAREFSP